MRKNIVSICVLALLLVTFSVFGQEDRNKGIINSALIGLEYEVKAGFNIGGTRSEEHTSELQSRE